MSSDFYKRSTALYEEFQKREQHFLDTEKNLNSSLLIKNGSIVSLQEYLRKINQRERETEDTYKNLLQQMENLDQRTDNMYFNLEKLSILKSTMLDSNLFSWRNVQDRFPAPLSSFQTSSSLNVGYNLENFNTPKQESCMQTDDLFCVQCRFPIHLSTHMQKISEKNYESDIKKTNINETDHPESPTSHFSNIKHSYDITQSICEVQDSEVVNIVIKSPVKSKNDIGRLNFESEKKNSVVSANSTLTSDTFSIINQKNQDEVLPSPLEGTLVGDKIVPNEDENSEVLNASVHDDPILNESNFGTKSDDESMNHEFNFLESEKSNESDKLGEHQPHYYSSDSHKQANVDDEISEVLVVGKKDDICSSNEIASNVINAPKNDLLDVKADDLRSESSMSATGLQSPLHSEPASIESDLDDFFDKGNPLTNTPAYQSLLGNIDLTNKVQKKQLHSDSDSEDSVEKALSKAVRNPNSVIPTVLPQMLKDEPKDTSSKEVNNGKTRNTTSDSQNKTQANILRNRRKVLFFDSSGSEMEPEIKPVKKNAADDDDEFDF